MDKNKKSLTKSRAWLYIALALVSPFILFWISFAYSFGYGFDPAPDPAGATILSAALLVATISSPVLAPYLAYRYFKQKDGLARYQLGKIPQKEITAMQQARKTNRNKQLIVIGIAAILTIVGIISPPIINNIRYELEYGGQSRSYWSARERGCREIQDFKIQQSSDESFGHYMLIKQLAAEKEKDALRGFSIRLSQSFPDCEDGKVSPVQQNALENEYLTYLEATAHAILNENPTKLSDAEISNIRESEARNHY